MSGCRRPQVLLLQSLTPVLWKLVLPVRFWEPAFGDI